MLISTDGLINEGKHKRPDSVGFMVDTFDASDEGAARSALGIQPFNKVN